MNPRLKSWKIGIAAAFSVATGSAVMCTVIAADTPIANGRGETAARVEIGKPAPDFELPVLKQAVNEKGEKVGRITDEKIKLSSFCGKKVVCLFTSSYTWPPFRKSAAEVDALYVAYKDNPRVAMFLVYVREAHPVKAEEQPEETDAKRPMGPGNITQHKTIDDRILAASACVEGMKLTLPVLIDTMDGVVEKAYQGVPAAMVIVDLDGNVASYAHGPTAVQPKEAKKVLKKLLGE